MEQIQDVVVQVSAAMLPIITTIGLVLRKFGKRVDYFLDRVETISENALKAAELLAVVSGISPEEKE